MKDQALQYYMHDGSTAFRFELKGNLNDEGAHKLDQAWRTASSVIGDRRLIVDMTFVTSVDDRGRALIARWHREGAQLIANSRASRALAECVLGEPLPALPANAGTAVSDRTWMPFRGSFLARAVTLLVLATVPFPNEAKGATLRSETVTSWDNYLQTANANLQDRARPGGSFLWTFENAERAAKVRGGEIVVAPASSQNPKKVPGGLIHHWMGAVFVPGVKLDDVLAVTRDYDHYKEFFHPFVIESKAIARTSSNDQFSMLLVNRALFRTMVLDADYEATNVRVDDGRFYSVSRTTRVQEIEEYGQPGECRKPQGEGGGYIWKLYSVARLERREGGVFIELEAIALSRDIPSAVRVVADPIVRRVSRNSLLTSLQQTEQAVRGISGSVARTGVVPASAGQVTGVSAAFWNKTPASPRVP
jgi:hypothetical protein